jgi:PAS domain S-box-containing protein
LNKENAIVNNFKASLQAKNSELEKELNTLKEYNNFLESMCKNSLFLILDSDTTKIKKSFGSSIFSTQQALNKGDIFTEQILNDGSRTLFENRLAQSLESKAETVFGIQLKASKTVIVTLSPGDESNEILLKIIKNDYQQSVSKLPDDIDYKKITENAPDTILIGNNKGEIIGANNNFTKISEYSFSEVEGKSISFILSEASVNKKPLRFDLLDAGEAIMNERQILTKGGKKVDVEMHSRRIDNFRYLSIIRDNTERKSMQEALVENEERYNKLLKNSPLGILYCDNTGQIIQINKSFLNILEPDSEKRALKINLLKYDPLVKNGFSDMLYECFDTGKQNVKEYEYRQQNGSLKFLKSYCIPLKDSNGNSSGAFIIAENITEQKEFISKLKKAKEKALESDRLKSAFLANISHEIRTPLNAVLGFAQLFDCNEYSNEELMRFKSSIIKGSNTLLALIEGIIKLSELQSGNIKINNEKISIDFLMKKLIDYANEEIHSVNKEIQLLYEYSTFQKYIYSDETLFTRVLKHLVNNAVKFTDSGFIKIGIYNKQDRLVFSVQDSGIGISDRQKKYIFDKFRQAESPEAEIYRGVGMGLALSKEIINKLNGKINVHSEIGKGSTFEVELPIQ